MRSMAIVDALNDAGCACGFAASSEESFSFLAGRGHGDCLVLNGDTLRFDYEDGRALAAAARQRGVSLVFIDSYAVTDSFFEGLRTELPADVMVAHLDDQYTFERGILDEPVRFPVNALLNYSFYCEPQAYENAYRGRGVQLLLGPSYAPLRPEFAKVRRHVPGEKLTDVLITTGSTNPDGLLERVARLVVQVVDASVRVHVVVGAKSSYEGPVAGIDILHNVSDMASLMESCQVAISAAGTTLYELCAAGVASLAIAMVPNQQKNMHGFVDQGFGLGCDASDSGEALSGKIRTLLEDTELRGDIVRRCAAGVDAGGAGRIAQELLRRLCA